MIDDGNAIHYGAVERGTPVYGSDEVEVGKVDEIVDNFREHIYMTFQDDFVAFATADQMNWRRLCWANDFPHSDSTWPWSQEMLTEQTDQLTDEQRRAILCDNTAELYGIDTSALPIGGDTLAATAAA